MSRMQDLTNPKSLRSKLRKKRLKYLLNLISSIITKEALTTVKICDIGGTYRYWIHFPFEKFEGINFEITLVNLEKRVLSEESNFKKLLNHPNVNFNSEVGNGCDMNHKEDNSYHLAHSNSVIEHIGNWSNIKDFAAETKRIGKFHFIQTPNFWFPIEPHYFMPFVHWFPRPTHTRLLMIFKKDNFDDATSQFDTNRMLSKKEFKFCYPDSKMTIERFFLLRKSFIVTSKLD